MADSGEDLVVEVPVGVTLTLDSGEEIGDYRMLSL